MDLMTCLSLRVATGDMSIFDAAERSAEQTAWQTPNMYHEDVLAWCQWQQGSVQFLLCPVWLMLIYNIVYLSCYIVHWSSQNLSEW